MPRCGANLQLLQLGLLARIIAPLRRAVCLSSLSGHGACYSLPRCSGLASSGGAMRCRCADTGIILHLSHGMLTTMVRQGAGSLGPTGSLSPEL